MRSAIPGGVISRAVLGVCIAAISVFAAGCGGTGSGGAGETSSGGGDATAVNIAQFCADYGKALTLFDGTYGDTTDPDWGRATTLLGKARAEAPDGTKPYVTKMYDIATEALNKAGNGQVYSADDFNAESQAVGDWATTNCTS